MSYFGALAPVAYIGHTTARVFVNLANTFADKWLETVGVEEFAASSSVFQQFFSRVRCVYAPDACQSLLQVIFGPSQNINASRVQGYVAQVPAGTSIKNVAHFAQGIRDDTFRSYDYGCSCYRALPLSLCSVAMCANKRVHGAFDPPEFELDAIEFPRIAFFSGDDDIMATARDIDRLRAKLPSRTTISDKVVAAFSHVDFVWGVNAHETVFTPMSSRTSSSSIPSEKGYD
ncbi:hypothetical protein PINS_up010941 [Pythium insidiosum]|nr:hypothetical protein PINS_up010941 [Pythium insidiosum]